MTNPEIGWESLLRSDAPSGCILKAALFTTYDRPDERLLAEHLLPLLLKLNREPESEGVERQYFLLELDERLKELHDRLVVISSTAREEPGDAETSDGGTYAWIWQSIRHLTVGRHAKAVQHAKLWLLHWGAANENGDEFLEIVVTSSNLTRSAFKSQLQAVWRACLELHPQRSEARLGGWGILPEFLRELAASAGDERSLALSLELLARADCPAGATFVASVPGKHTRQELRRTPWGAAGLQKILPAGNGTVTAAILCPFIGAWNADSLSRWCDSIDGAPARLELVWIDVDHRWAKAKRWLLPDATLKTLNDNGATLLRLKYDPSNQQNPDLFHDDHRPSDDRWSHAKVYSFKRGNSRRLLVTSANFSQAAWGTPNQDGSLAIENFELGVCVERANWPFAHLEAFDNDQVPATVATLPQRGSALIMWARATWDGKSVAVDCRCDGNSEPTGEISFAGEWTPITDWATDADKCLHSAQVPCHDAKRRPLVARIVCKSESISVPVFDERPAQDREDAVPAEVDENLVQSMRDELLFEQYGGRVATDGADDQLADDSPNTNPDDEDDKSGADEETGNARPVDSYAVPAFDRARQHLRIVDNWADQVKHSRMRGVAAFDKRLLRRDGQLLIEAFHRQADRDREKGAIFAIGAMLAAEELTLRFKHFPEA